MNTFRFLVEYWGLVALVGAGVGAFLGAQGYRRLGARGRERWFGWLLGGAGVVLLAASAMSCAIMAVYGQQVRGIVVDVGSYFGAPAPALAFDRTGAPGDAVGTLADHRGRVVLLQFWATWCGGSSARMPDLSALAESVKGDVVVLSLTDEPREQLDRYLASQGEFQQIIGRVLPPVADPYTVMSRGRPMSFIIDRDGVIREHFFGSKSTQELYERVAVYR
jgi:cytochrome c biogenesis protein CcmG, thiol:disulfide interchange protein DsbE